MSYQYFISSRWRNKEQVLDLVRKLRAKGKSVYCFFEDNDSKFVLKTSGQTADPEEYMQKFETIPNWQTDPDVREIFETDMNALKASETLVLLLPAGKSSHIEAGAAYGMGKHCIVIGEMKETESLYFIFDEFYTTSEEFLQKL